MLYKLAITSFIEMIKDINYDAGNNYAIESPYQIFTILFLAVFCLPLLLFDIATLPLQLLSLIIYKFGGNIDE